MRKLFLALACCLLTSSAWAWEYAPDATSKCLDIFVPDSTSTTGAGLTGLAYNTSGLTFKYHRSNGSSETTPTLADMTLGTFTSNGFKATSNGRYQLCPENAAFATGADYVSMVLYGAANMVPVPIVVELKSGATTTPDLLQTTTIATLASQTSFTLTAGSGDDNAYKWAIAVVTDASTSTQKAVGVVSAYTGSTKTVTLREDPGVFTMAVGDSISIVASDKGSAVCTLVKCDGNTIQFNGTAATASGGRPEVNTTHLGGTSQTGRDIGASVLLSPGTGAGQISLASGAVTVGTLASAAIQSIWDALTSAMTTSGSIGKKLADLVLGSDSKVILSNNAHTGAVVPTVTTLTNPVSITSTDLTKLGFLGIVDLTGNTGTWRLTVNGSTPITVTGQWVGDNLLCDLGSGRYESRRIKRTTNGSPDMMDVESMSNPATPADANAGFFTVPTGTCYVTKGEK